MDIKVELRYFKAHQYDVIKQRFKDLEYRLSHGMYGEPHDNTLKDVHTAWLRAYEAGDWRESDRLITEYDNRGGIA